MTKTNPSGTKLSSAATATCLNCRATTAIVITLDLNENKIDISIPPSKNTTPKSLRCYECGFNEFQIELQAYAHVFLLFLSNNQFRP